VGITLPTTGRIGFHLLSDPTIFPVFFTSIGSGKIGMANSSGPGLVKFCCCFCKYLLGPLSQCLCIFRGIDFLGVGACLHNGREFS